MPQDAGARGSPAPGPDPEEPGRLAPAERASSPRPNRSTIRPSHGSNQAHAADPKHPEIRNELALASDARGWINRELGDIKAGRAKTSAAALELLEKLVAEFPTAPRYRESLAKACNSLGLLEETTGSLVEAEAFYRRELPLVERLAQDFPDRPEHGRELARTLSNLGNVLARNRDAGAEVVLQRAVDVNGPLTTKHPEDVQIRFDLAKDLSMPGRSPVRAREARSRPRIDPCIAIAQRSPGQGIPRQTAIREVLAMNLADTALVLHALNKPQSEATFQESAAIYEKLVASYPDNFDYKIGQARCLRDQGTVVASLEPCPRRPRLSTARPWLCSMPGTPGLRRPNRFAFKPDYSIIWAIFTSRRRKGLRRFNRTLNPSPGSPVAGQQRPS